MSVSKQKQEDASAVSEAEKSSAEKYSTWDRSDTGVTDKAKLLTESDQERKKNFQNQWMFSSSILRKIVLKPLNHGWHADFVKFFIPSKLLKKGYE